MAFVIVQTAQEQQNASVRDRSQVFNPQTKVWTKRDASSGQFMDQKADSEPFKGVRKEKPVK